MGRLIDADAFAESLIHCDGLGRKSLEAVLNTLNEQPTAYNTEKLVAELEELSFETEIVIPGSDGYDDTEIREIICTENAIDIVKKGGVE